ncbi:MAG: glycosyl hydrolase family 30 [Bacteroidetes bacterium]|nr:glycosyl hydrolase family 30 [Bacteroidota bacterium]
MLVAVGVGLYSCTEKNNMQVEVFETRAGKAPFQQIQISDVEDSAHTLKINLSKRYQRITGFGGSFTEASAYLLNQLSKKNQKAIIEAYFGETGARYSLTRKHMNSCDFSLSQYSYAPVPGDTALENFSIAEDSSDVIPMIKKAMEASEEGFRIISSPWTAPPWMKTNKDWVGGRLLPEHYGTWALFFKKYIEAYQERGIPIWGVTVENEPLGNDSNWESMHFSPSEMNTFVKDHLGPELAGLESEVKILGYDQNRDEAMYDWIDTLYGDSKAASYYDGFAVHWYASTYDYFPKALAYAHNKGPDKLIIQSEACIDAQQPVWQDDAWYWSKEATDWGYRWAPEDQKYLHPKYVPVYRYARDIIGCLNHHVNGWVDWNMILNREGGPNWFKNWCVAPVIVDEALDEVYFTPLFYVMKHFSRFIRPEAVRIGFDFEGDEMMCTAVQNPDNSIVVILFNPMKKRETIEISLKDQTLGLSIAPQALQTIIID